MAKNKILLIILDGYGEGKDYKYNAVKKAKTPYLSELRKKYPSTILKTDGENVGLPKNTMGGSEVGHFTMGAGRIIFQSMEEINRSIKNKSFFDMKDLKKAAENCRKNSSSFHILGMISDEGIHSHIDHLFALLKFAKKEKLKKVYIHAITDGRDVEEKSASEFIKKIEDKIKEIKIGKIASIIGRFYAMDRDKNWNRTSKAYELLTLGKGTKEINALSALRNEYKRKTKTDYYIKPIILDKEGIIQNEDSVVFFNFRTDRAQQLTESFTIKNFKEFERKKLILPKFICFGPYTKTAPVLFPTKKVKHNLSEILSKNGLKQLKIAETEKYAHVTFFFNSQIKEPNKNETQLMIPSPKVKSYDMKPEMSAPEITEKLIRILDDKPNYDFIVLNFANCDLVGHSGNFEATKKAIETLDKCLKIIVTKAKEKDYLTLITGDHGNAEYMKYENGDNCPSHTRNPVIFILIDDKNKNISLKKSKNLGLKDVAPTILDLMKIKKPKEMTGNSLIIQK